MGYDVYYILFYIIIQNMVRLTYKDHSKILDFYKKPVPQPPLSKKQRQNLKKKTDHLLAIKLCKCIKEVNRKGINEPRAIGICTRSVFSGKGLVRGAFSCKAKQQVVYSKKGTNLTRRKRRTKRDSNSRPLG